MTSTILGARSALMKKNAISALLGDKGYRKGRGEPRGGGGYSFI
jgi:hypothetical protein